MFDPISPFVKLAERLYSVKPLWWNYASAGNCALRVARDMGIDACLLPRIAYNAIFCGVAYDGNIDAMPYCANPPKVPTQEEYRAVEPCFVADAIMMWQDHRRAISPIEIMQKAQVFA